jgi:hypothetical protein
MLERLYAGFTALPGVMRIGLLLVFAGGVLDGCYHTLPLHWAARVDTYIGQSGWPLHLLILIGMATTMVGLFAGRASLRASRHRHVERSTASKH